MPIDDERLEAYIDQEMDARDTEEFEREIELAPSDTRELLAEQLAIDGALQALMEEKGREVERRIVNSVTDRLTGELPDLAKTTPETTPSDPHRPPPTLCLRITAGPQAGRSRPLSEFDLAGGELTIGRSSTAGLPLADKGTSREHTAVRFADGKVLVRDLGSRNGTKVNGKTIDGETILAIGDQIQIGRTILVLGSLGTGGTFRIIGLDGNVAGQTWNLQSDVTTIGRGAKADISIEDNAASRLHTSVIIDQDQLYIEDLNSSNGTFLNGDKISRRTAVRSGDVVQVGATNFEVNDCRIDDLSGSVFHGYHVLDRVGAGTFGVVYQGRHSDTDRLVAIKIVDPDLVKEPADRARLINQVRNARRVEHDHIHPILDEGIHDDLVYIITPWAENGSLADLITDPDDLPDPTVVAALTLDAARGLAYAAEQGIYHRGMRPGDILISAEGDGLISDLGFAPKNEFNDQPGASRPHYTPTEELDGREPDHLSNQYSLGCLMYHALTGEAPYGGGSVSDVAQGQRTGALPAIRDYNPTCPTNLQNLISRMTARNPDKRYADWSAVIADLEKVVTSGASALIEAAAPEDRTIKEESPGAPPPRHAPVRGRGGPRPAASNRQRAQANRDKMPDSIKILLVAIACIVGLLFLVPTMMRGGGQDQRADATSGQTQPKPDRATSNWTPDSDDDSTEATTERKGGTWTSPDAAQRLGQQDPTDKILASIPPATQATEDTTPAVSDDVRRMIADDQPETVDSDPQPVISKRPPATQDPEPVTEQADPEPEPIASKSLEPAETENDKPEPEVVEAPQGLQDREGPLVHAARPGTWEEGSVILTDGSELAGTFLVRGSTIVLKTTEGTQQDIPERHVATLEFTRPKHLKINNGDRRFAKKAFNEALEYYQLAQEELGDDPYVNTRIKQCQVYQKELDSSLAMINGGMADKQWRQVLDGLGTYVRIMEPKRLDKDMETGFQEAFAYEAIKADAATRSKWEALGASLKIKLGYDPEAPAKLKAAMSAYAAKQDGKDVAKLFDTALDAKAPFGDTEWMAYAETHLTLGNKTKVIDGLQKLSPAKAKDPRVQQMMEAVGLKPPSLKPELLCLSYVGGKGDDAFTSVEFSSAGMPVAKGNGFSFTFNPNTLKGSISGSPTGTTMEKPPGYKPGLSPTSVTVPATGETVTIRYKQVHGILQQPFLNSTAGWKFWSWGKDEAEKRSLMADSRGYRAWLMPDGKHIGVMCWTDGGNSTLDRHPQDLDKNWKGSPVFDGAYSRICGGMSTLIMKINVPEQKPVGATWLASHVFNYASDPWGRLYCANQKSRRWADKTQQDHFGLGAEIKTGGLFVLDDDLKTNIYHAMVGGTDATRQNTGLIAVHNNLCIIAGYTDAKSMKTVNAPQDSLGGGLDGLVAVIKLW